MLSNELLEILACPQCHASLESLNNDEGLACATCGLVFPVRDSIPVMLLEEAVERAAWDEGQRVKA